MGSSTRLYGIATATLSMFVVNAHAAAGHVNLRSDGADTVIQVLGDDDVDWHIQTSTNLVQWETRPDLGPLLSRDANAPSRSVEVSDESSRYFRAVQTEGLFDDTLMRTIYLTFTQANWQVLLDRARTSGSNIFGHLTLDNGATNSGIGARYKGNTSYSMSGAKKSINIQIDFLSPGAELMRYETLNINNAAGDETILREPLYFNVMHRYAVSPRAALAKLYVNGAYWGVYSLAQQEDGDLIKEWFPSNNGDRWRAPNAGGGGGPGGGGRPPGGGPGRGGFGSALSALSYLGTNVASYKSNYELKKQNSTNAWEILVHAIDVLNNTPITDLRDRVEEVLAVDRWLWFLAVENIFADDDSYFNKGADYGFYYEPESGRIHPIEHDGNESFTAGDVQLSPVQGATGTNRPVLARFLAVSELRQRYLAHLRTVLEESFQPDVLTPLIDRYSALSLVAITADPKKSYTMASYANDLAALKAFVANRYKYLTNHAELQPVAPTIVSVFEPEPPAAEYPATVTAEVRSYASEGIDSVWLYFRAGSAGKFARTEMFDDGEHEDGTADDRVFGARIKGFSAGTQVRYYVEARSGNSAHAASFAPARAEEITFSYRVVPPMGGTSPVLINELMADNSRTTSDPQGQFDDWIELYNSTNTEIDLTGYYLSDKPDNPRKWRFPDGTRIAANGYLLIWADEDASDSPGLHASFKLGAEGETLLLVGPDADLNPLLDSVNYPGLTEDASYGRPTDGAPSFAVMSPTPGRANSAVSR